MFLPGSSAARLVVTPQRIDIVNIAYIVSGADAWLYTPPASSSITSEPRMHLSYS